MPKKKKGSKLGSSPGISEVTPDRSAREADDEVSSKKSDGGKLLSRVKELIHGDKDGFQGSYTELMEMFNLLGEKFQQQRLPTTVNDEIVPETQMESSNLPSADLVLDSQELDCSSKGNHSTVKMMEDNPWHKFDISKIRNSGSKLRYIEPNVIDGKKVAIIEEKDIEKQVRYWESAAVCYVLGANPPFHVINGFFNRIWKGKGINKVVQGCFMALYQGNT